MRHKNHVPFLVVGRDQQGIRSGAIPTTKQQKIQASETIEAQTHRFLAHGGKIAREDESLMLQRKTPLKTKKPLKAKSSLKAKAPMKSASRPKVSKIRQSARNQACTVGTPHICNGNPETVVLAHLNGAGIGAKHPDWMGAWACSACHALIDGEYVKYGITRDERDLLHYKAILKTQEHLFNMGLLKIAE